MTIQKSDRDEKLEAAYQRFMADQQPARKDEAGQDLIRAIFGEDSIAEDPSVRLE